MAASVWGRRTLFDPFPTALTMTSSLCLSLSSMMDKAASTLGCGREPSVPQLGFFPV